MAIKLECYQIIVPISKIEAKYPGGWQGCLANHQRHLPNGTCYDKYLFSDLAMNPMDIDAKGDQWESLGFTGFKGDLETGRWIDFCICDMFFGPLNCDWLVRDGMTVSFKENK